MKLLKFSSLVVGLLAFVRASQAASIASDNFDYPVGSTLSNVVGGTGWLGPWLGANFGAGPQINEFVITNGYSWSNTSGGYILGSGGAIIDNDGAQNRQSFRQWFDPNTDITSNLGTNIWYSFIATFDAASGSGGSVNLFETLGDVTAGAGVACTGPAGAGQFVVQIRGPSGQGVFSGSTANLVSSQPGTNLVVARVQLAPGPQTGFPLGSDRIDVWLNQTVEPTNNSDLYFTGFAAPRAFPWSSGYLGIRTGGGCQMTIDEVKIGTSFADVVPLTAKSPNPKPASPLLTLEPSGPAGLQFCTSEATATNSNEIVTYYTTNSFGSSVPIECAWVSKTPASYSYTIAQGPKPGPTNFMAYAWLVPSWNGHIQALDNPDAIQLALISDGHGGAKAILGYYVNSGSSVQENLQKLLTTGVICTIPSAPFAGTWTINATSDTGFTVVAPNGASASGNLQSGDEALFASSLRFLLGVSPNGGPNVGNPSLGNYLTVSGLTITNNPDGLVVQGDWTTGQPFLALNPPNFLISANFPSCIYVMPSNSVYRATWNEATGPGVGANLLTANSSVSGGGGWSASLPSSSVLSDGTNVTFITTGNLTNAAEFFRVSIPYSPY